MQTRFFKFFKFVHLFGDILILNLSYVLAHLVRHRDFEYLQEESYQLLWFNLNIFWLLGSSILGIYSINRTFRYENVFSDLLKLVMTQIMFTAVFVVMVKGFHYSREHFVLFFLFFIILLFFWRFALLQFVKQLRFAGYNLRNIIIVGLSPQGYQFMDLINSNAEYGYKFLGFFDDRPKKYVNKDFIVGAIDEAQDFALKNKVSELYCALPLDESEKIQDLMMFCDKNLIRFKILPDFRGIMNKKFTIDFYDFMPVLLIRNEPLESLYNRTVKRAFDLVFSGLVIILILSWLYPIVALLIKLNSRGPVFFKQKRSGYKNRTFQCYKFRTMQVNNEADSLMALQDDPRITAVGRFLRKFHLDEIPQFLNVFLGHMSVVGPRPYMLAHTKEYGDMIDRFMVRYFVKPGITGLAQVKGYRGEINPSMMEKRVMADIEYIENWNFLLDIKIIMLTIRGILVAEHNVY